ncbi:unnamed protein product [Callosobruchus maculatus]|uniref:Uncharacterized protein n=1 Tax=Callosobruchus maculatus TaxID=64391 RepID=A0A653DCB9_CALMS|nr:unnamed protein product [Callosobruchus maculatus]
MGIDKMVKHLERRRALFGKMVHKWAQFTYITAPHKVILVDDSNDLNKCEEPDIGQSQDESNMDGF